MKRIVDAIDRVDQCVIGCHQKVIDMTHLGPRWWVENTAYAYAVTAISTWGIVGNWLAHALSLVVVLSCAALVVVCARVPTWFPILSRYGIQRVYCLFLTATAVGFDVWRLMVGSNPPPRWFLIDILLVLWASIMYFAACKPPAPPRRREQLAAAGGLS